MAYTTIDNPEEHFDIALYTGTGSSQAITGVEFQPDWVWTKGRSVAYSHYLFDSTRGVQKRLMANNTNAEDTLGTGVTAFNTDGFTHGGEDGIGQNTKTFVGWMWKANGGTTSSNSDGSVTSTVQANTTAGFSIVTFTEPGSGTYTVGHGLGVVPSMIIVMARSVAGENKIVFHKDIEAAPTNEGVYLNSNSAKFGAGANWLTENTTARFGITVGQVTPGGHTMVAYCFNDIKGYSKIGKYKGNGNANGPFIYTGFRPAWIMMKDTDTGDWLIYDTSRNVNNLSGSYLQPNNSDTEGTESNGIDILSNGFKQRNTFNNLNASGNTYIYMAFAEAPFVSSEGTPVTAR